MNDSIYGQIKRFRIKKTGGISPRNFCILLIIWFHVLFKTQFVQPLKHNFLFSVIIEMLLCLTASQHWINSGVSHSPAPSHILRFSSVQFSHSVVSSYLQPHGVQHARPPCPSPTPELAQTHVHWVSDAIQPSHPLSSPSPPAFNLSQHQGLYSESVLHIRWPNYWRFSFSISSSNEYSGLTSFRIDWFDLFAVQVTLKSFSNTTVQKHQFFRAQLSL